METFVVRYGQPELRLSRLTLPRGEAPAVLRLLSHEGIDGSSMFPGADGVVRSLREQASWSRPGSSPSRGEIENVRNKCTLAVHALAASAAPLRERLDDALEALLVLRSEDMPDEDLRSQFVDLVQRVTRVEVPAREGRQKATLEHMTDDELEAVAKTICELHEGLVDGVDEAQEGA